MSRRPANWDANEVLNRIVIGAGVGDDPMQGIEMWGDVSDLDRSMIDGWLADLVAAESSIRQLRYRLESLRSERACWTCGGPVVGRSDRVYCSAACRVENHRGTSSRMKEQREARRAQRAADSLRTGLTR